MKLKPSDSSSNVPQLAKEKSVLDENVSETLLGQAFEVIFREFERYINMMTSFKGIDWGVYVRMRNQERKRGDAPKQLVNEENILLDEIEVEEQPEEKKDEENDSKDQKQEDKKEEQKEELKEQPNTEND